jgi:hypothetical protein
MRSADGFKVFPRMSDLSEEEAQNRAKQMINHEGFDDVRLIESASLSLSSYP